MFSVSTSFQSNKKQRCLECKRRKKRCEISLDKSSCVFCLKKNITCQFEETDQEVRYHNIEKSKKVKKLDSTVQPLKSISFEGMTPSAFIKLVNKLKVSESPEKDELEKISFMRTPLIYLPTITISQYSEGVPTIEDQTTLRVIDEEVHLPKNFSLGDFLMSSIRVNQDVTAYSKASLNTMTNINIKDFIKNNVDRETMNFFKKDGRFPSVKSLTSDQSSQKVSATSYDFDQKSSDKAFNEIEFHIDPDNLKMKLHFKEAAIEFSDQPEHKKFINLPKYVDNDFAMNLFEYFCSVCQDQTALTPESNTDLIKVNFLKVCLPLILGNVTVLKCVLLVSYYDILVFKSNDYLRAMEQKMRDLHLGVLEELKDQLTFCYSVCCDHSILSVLLLLKIEVIKGTRSSLWKKLLRLGQSMISFRGGVSVLSSKITTLCLVKFFCIHFATGLLSFDLTRPEYGDPLSLNDFIKLVNTDLQLDFFDSYNYAHSFGLYDMKEAIEIYGHITQLHNLVSVSYDANFTSVSSKKNKESLGTVSFANLKMVISESYDLENEIIRMISDGSLMDGKELSHQYQLQLNFALRASQLYLYQLVYRQGSLSIKSTMVVQELLVEVRKLFDELLHLNYEIRVIVFILPLFVLGVDLVSKKSRSWYKGKLKELFTLSKKESIKTCIDLLDEVWKINPEGPVYVDWKQLSDKHSLFISLTA